MRHYLNGSAAVYVSTWYSQVLQISRFTCNTILLVKRSSIGYLRRESLRSVTSVIYPRAYNSLIYALLIR
jgi:hypothetical protein